MPPGLERRGNFLRPCAGAAVALALLPLPAEAHTALQGIGGFWSGAEHLLTSFDQLGFLLGLAICTSFGDRRRDAEVIGIAFLALLIGAAGAAAGLPPGFDLAAPVAALMLVVGLLGALRLRLGQGPLLGLAAAGGLAGGAAGADAAAGVSLALFAVGGGIAGASVLSYGLLAARRLDAEWGGIARRAGASWIAAIGLIVLAFCYVRDFGRLS